MKAMSSTFKKTLLSSLIVPFTLGASSASAALINEWGYVVDSGFSNEQETAGEIPTLTKSDDNRTLSWGLGDSESSVSIENVNQSSGGLFTNGPAVEGGTFTHSNNVLPAQGAALESFDLTSTLTLFPVDPAGDSITLQSTVFMNFFSETLNEAPCFEGSTGTACDDIFTIGNVDDLGVIDTGDGFEFESMFDYEDITYTVYLELIGLTALSDEACAEAGTSNGCIGLLTQEGLDNDFETQFRIEAQAPVPEPGTLALLGMGLAGLGLARRKRATKA